MRGEAVGTKIQRWGRSGSSRFCFWRLAARRWWAWSRSSLLRQAQISAVGQDSETLRGGRGPEAFALGGRGGVAELQVAG